MRAHLLPLVSGLVLAGAVASAPARAEGSWTGPGWYVEGSQLGFDSTLISGPYSTEAECKAAQPADDNDYAYDCEYEQTDPTVSPPPKR